MYYCKRTSVKPLRRCIMHRVYVMLMDIVGRRRWRVPTKKEQMKRKKRRLQSAASNR